MHESSDFFTLFLAVSRRLESIAVRLGPPLSIEESQILTLIHARNTGHTQLTAHEIAELLQIEKSSLSRKLARLASAGLLKQAKDSSDRRKKFLELSFQGESTIESDQQIRNSQVEEFATPLSIPERRKFTRIVEVFADNLEAAEVSMGSTDHPLKIQLTRLTRCLGFLGANLFETGYPLEECQILAVLGEHPRGIPLTKLKEELPYDKSKMSRLIQAYEQRGFAASKIDSDDKRKVFVTLTKKGASELLAMQTSARRLFERGLSSMNSAERILLQEMLQRITNSVGAAHGSQFDFKPMTSGAERKAARTFFLHQLARLEFLSAAPASFAHPDSELLAAFENEKLIGILEWSAKGSRLRIENLLSSEHDGFGVAAAALALALKESFARDAHVEIAAPYLSDFLMKKSAQPSKRLPDALNLSSLANILS